MTFKCKMCGGELQPQENATTCKCEFCGTTQTLPRLDNERRANMYDRANHFRRQNEYDKAMGIFEQILQEDRTDAEAYWSLVLCRYGIEYVEDPATGKRVPTVNRVQYTSILADEDYKSALEYADDFQKGIYEEEAKTIDGIQKGILDISKREKPFDVFICYKETDEHGQRTRDSVLANDLYHQLTREGYKVFFSRITLEDKIGQQYEPYIFAALNSAKVMVVIGTKREYFNAVWVKNEWSRYLALIKAGADKTLVPAYRDMDPYDLPEEFSHLQALDMGKLGFMQDLIYGIKKLTRTEKPEPTQLATNTTVVNANSNVTALLDRAFLSLEDGEWAKADDFCEKALNLDARNGRAYLGKLMAELKVHKEEGLKDQAQPFENNGNYQKVIRFGDDALKSQINGYIDYIKERNEQQRKQSILESAKNQLFMAKTVEECQTVIRLLRDITGFDGAEEISRQCDEKIEKINAADYEYAFALQDRREWDKAHQWFAKLGTYKDSKEQAVNCQKAKEEEKREEENRKEQERIEAKAQAKGKRAKRIQRAVIAIVLIVAILSGYLVYSNVLRPKGIYKSAISAREAGDFVKAIAMFTELGEYSDSAMQIKETKYQQAQALTSLGKYDAAIAVYGELDGYSGSSALLKSTKYEKAKSLVQAEKFDEAIALFAELGNGYRDTDTQIKETKYQKAIALRSSGKYVDATKLFEELDGYSDAATQINETEYQRALYYKSINWNDAAIDAFSALGNYRDSETLANELKEEKYQQATEMVASGKYDNAIEVFVSLGDYSDSATQVKEIKYNRAKALMVSLEYSEAITILHSIIGYRDADSLLSTAKFAELDLMYQVGKYVTFGHYPQKSSGTDSTDIEWQVLARDGDKALLLSRFALDCKPYNTAKADVTWETCTLRTWLNRDFINRAFTSDEQTAIMITNIDNSESQCYSEWKTSGGNDTQDRIFLLSYAEANKYLNVSCNANNMKSCTSPTSYAMKQGASTLNNYKTSEGKEACWWWLRSPGSIQNMAADIYYDGSLYSYYVHNSHNAVRPAFWIDLSALITPVSMIDNARDSVEN